MLNLGQAVIISLGLGLVMLMAADGVQVKTMTVGQFVLVNTYLMQLYQPLNFLGFVYREIKQGLVDMEQMFRLMSVNQEVADRPGAINLAAHPTSAGSRPAPSPSGTCISATTPTARSCAASASRLPAGSKLAVVGPTGAGKSTISRLLFRFYDVTEGAVEIDGVDVRDMAQTSLRAAIGVVPQDTVLFNDTIGYNIAYGRPGATQAEIENAAKLAQVHDFVLRMPEGYSTRVGERGLKLSGGEKQRVAIARTILKDPRILILDEATSALDSRTEHEIESALRTVAANRNHVGDRPPPVHRRGRGRDTGLAGRPSGGARHPCLAAGAGRPVCPHVGDAGRAGRVGGAGGGAIASARVGWDGGVAI